jgi:hypothetical protein
MNAHKAKATDLVVESLKLIVTIATLFLGALLAYSSNVTSPVIKWAFYTALSSFVICSIFSILNINSLINKLYREEDDAIMQSEAKILNIISALALIIGLITTSIYIKYNPVNTKTPSSTSPATTVISDDQIVVGADVKTPIQIRRNESGKIEEVIIGK